VGSVKIVRKLFVFQTWMIWVVKGSIDQKAVMSRSTSEAM